MSLHAMLLDRGKVQRSHARSVLRPVRCDSFVVPLCETTGAMTIIMDAGHGVELVPCESARKETTTTAFFPEATWS